MNEKGILYEGNWHEGKQHGQGSLYTTADLKLVTEGNWQMGQLEMMPHTARSNKIELE